jgi:hypothetical protein
MRYIASCFDMGGALPSPVADINWCLLWGLCSPIWRRWRLSSTMQRPRPSCWLIKQKSTSHNDDRVQRQSEHWLMRTPP